MYRTKQILYSLAFLVLMFSGVNFFSDQIIASLVFLVFLLLFYVIRPSKIDSSFIFLSFAFFIVFILQSITFKLTSPYYFIRYFAFVLLIPYLILKFLPLNYHKYIIKIVFVLTILDLGLWILSLINPGINSFLIQLASNLRLDPSSITPQSLIIYTHEQAQSMGISRFSGFWHEPGAYAVLLGYCICFNTLIKNKLQSKENLIFFIGLLATLSTTAYFAIAISLYVYLLIFIKRKTFLKIILIPILTVIIPYLYNRLDFMENKVESQLETQMEYDISGTPTSGRILGFRKSLHVILKYPFFGRGLSTQTQAEIESAERTGYGWPGYYARIGLPLSIALSILFYKGLLLYVNYYNANKKWAIVFITLFTILLFSQKHTSTIIFMMIFLTPIAYANRIKIILAKRSMISH